MVNVDRKYGNTNVMWFNDVSMVLIGCNVISLHVSTVFYSSFILFETEHEKLIITQGNRVITNGYLLIDML